MHRTLLALAAVASIADAGSAASALPPGRGGRASPMSRGHLRRILHTVLEDGLTFRHLREVPASEGDAGESGGRGLRGRGSVETDASDPPAMPSDDEVWDLVTRHGWERARTRTGSRRLVTATDAGFVVCNSAPDESGHERLGSLLNLLEMTEDGSQVLYNADDESCFLLSAGAEAVHSLLHGGTVEEEVTGEGEDLAAHLTVMPMLDLLKLPSHTAMSLLEDDWSPDLSTLTRSVVMDEFSYEDTVEVDEEVDLEDWRRSILVDLLPSPDGETTGAGSEGEGIVYDVMDHVASLADPTSNATASLREAFSLTGVSLGEHGRMFERHSIWSRALEQGFESAHGCGNMMERMEVRIRRSWDEESLGGSVGGFEGTFDKTEVHCLGLKILCISLTALSKHSTLFICLNPCLSCRPSSHTAPAIGLHGRVGGRLVSAQPTLRSVPSHGAVDPPVGADGRGGQAGGPGDILAVFDRRHLRRGQRRRRRGKCRIGRVVVARRLR